MSKVEITVPEHLGMQIVQLIEQGEFVDRDEAIEDLLSVGIRACKMGDPVSDEDRVHEDDGMMDHEDEYAF